MEIAGFSAILILREINFGEPRSAKTAIFTILGAVNFVDLVKFSLQKVQKFIKPKFRASKWQKKAVLQFPHPPKLISRKI